MSAVGANEQEWRARVREVEEKAERDTREAKSALSTALDRHVAEVDSKIISSRDAELAQLQRRLEDIEEASAALRDERAPLFQQLQRKLDTSLTKLQEQDCAARQRRDELHARETELTEVRTRASIKSARARKTNHNRAEF